MKKSYPTILFALVALLVTSCSGGSNELAASNINGQNFNYLEIEKNCEVIRQPGMQMVNLECGLEKLRPVERACIGHINGGLHSIDISCSGDLWEISQKCRMILTSANSGEISC